MQVWRSVLHQRPPFHFNNGTSRGLKRRIKCFAAILAVIFAVRKGRVFDKNQTSATYGWCKLNLENLGDLRWCLITSFVHSLHLTRKITISMLISGCLANTTRLCATVSYIAVAVAHK